MTSLDPTPTGLLPSGQNPFPDPVDARIGGEFVKAVNARDLHALLRNGDHFSSWIKSRIEKYNFVENQDFTTVSEITETVKDGKTYRSPRVDFYVSADMAKELAMVENNDIGRACRRHLIKCEKRVKAGLAAAPTVDLNDPVLLQGLLLTQCTKRIEAERRADAAEAQVAVAKPKVEAYDRFIEADGSYLISVVAATLDQPQRKFFSWMKEHILTRRDRSWIPRAEFRNRGFFDVRPVVYGGVAGYQTRVTARGVDWIACSLGITQPDLFQGRMLS